jgi:hypothetical protein
MAICEWANSTAREEGQLPAQKVQLLWQVEGKTQCGENLVISEQYQRFPRQ